MVLNESRNLAEHIAAYADHVPNSIQPEVEGASRVLWHDHLEAVGCNVAMGGHCLIDVDQDQH